MMQTPRSAKKGSTFGQSNRNSMVNFNDVQSKVKEAVEGTQLGMYGFEQALKSVTGSKHHGGTVNEDHLILAFNRLKV